MKFDVYSFTNVGDQKINEDCCRYSFDEEQGLFVVADGLGGHQKGDFASEQVCEKFFSSWNEEREEEVPLKEWMEQQAENINDHLLALQEEMQCIFKSTVVALAITKEQAMWMNVGDSRLYHFHDQELASITKDQSMAYIKYRAGEISFDEISRDEDQCVLLSALGNARKHKPHVYDEGFEPSKEDAFVLCTDGAWTYLTREEIQEKLKEAEDAKAWGESLTELVTSRLEEGSDNFTIMTVMIE